MFHAPDNNASLQLSEVLNDIGISERWLRKRRRAYLLQETTRAISKRIVGHQHSVYLLGSQSEGTTTAELHSDIDMLICQNHCSVIQDWAEWSPDKPNLLMIQDDTTPPGYCYLQHTRDNAPLPCTEEHYKYFEKDIHGRVLMKNTAFDDLRPPGRQRDGPSFVDAGGPHLRATDTVYALPFKSLPLSVQHWLDQEHSVWPTAKMRRYAATSDCFVVATGSNVSENKDFQWRISTSLAERCLMFNLNITQIRCYILLKMILKTFINLHGQKNITSYMCKTVLLHCVRSKPSYEWKESNILNCLIYCLSTLNHCILCGNCPHFIIPGNNLMAGKISAINRCWLREKMSNLIRHTVDHLIEIQIDDLGQRLFLKLDIIPDADYNATFYIENIVGSLTDAAALVTDTAFYINSSHTQYLLILNNKGFEEQMPVLSQTVANLVRFHNEGNVLEKAACRLLTPFYCTTLGSLMASYNIQHNNPVSPQALEWLSSGMNSDVTSSRLKIASVFYRVDEMESAVLILRHTEAQYNIHVVQPVCECYANRPSTVHLGFCKLSYNYNVETLKYISAFCVKFLPTEINCIPKELQYEMFRSTEEERQHRRQGDDWMDLAVVDSIPYLYFLQYKTYGYLQRVQDQQQALSKLLRVTLSQENMGHRETAWNLLGQCMVQESRLNDALQCYRNSIHVRQSNNVAIIHICRLLASLVPLAREN